jgi:hypothetical protein
MEQRLDRVVAEQRRLGDRPKNIAPDPSLLLWALTFAPEVGGGRGAPVVSQASTTSANGSSFSCR